MSRKDRMTDEPDKAEPTKPTSDGKPFVSPYLRRPLRKPEDVERERKKRDGSDPPERSNDDEGGKRDE